MYFALRAPLSCYVWHSRYDRGRGGGVSSDFKPKSSEPLKQVCEQLCAFGEAVA